MWCTVYANCPFPNTLLKNRRQNYNIIIFTKNFTSKNTRLFRHTRVDRKIPFTHERQLKIASVFQKRAGILWTSIHRKVSIVSLNLKSLVWGRGTHSPKHVTNKSVPAYVFLSFVGSSSIPNKLLWLCYLYGDRMVTSCQVKTILMGF